MAYDVRIVVSIVLLFLGILFQIWTLTPWPGIPFLIMSAGLMLVKGYDSRARMKRYSPDTNWTDVDMKQIEEIEVLRKKNREWDRDALDITNSIGCLVFFAVIGLVAVLTIAVGALTGDPILAMIIPVDGAILLMPLWLTGLRFILTQPNLAVKVRLIRKLEEQFRSIRTENETFAPALKLTRDVRGNSVPIDARFTIRMRPSPNGYYGLQAQININLVQGTSYPYFYCVLAAQPGFGLKQYLPSVPQTDKIICEYQEDEQAEVLVIRQFTTKKSGYHTNDKVCWEIMYIAVQSARIVTGQTPSDSRQ